MNLKLKLTAGAALAACSIGSFAATAACPAVIAAPTTPEEAEILVNNCKPAATLFIGGASTMKDNVLTVANAQVFDASFPPIQIVDNFTATKANVKAYLGKAKSGVGALGGKLVYLVYNYNNGSAGGVSQLLAKTPKLADQSNPLLAIPEADVPFIGPAKDQVTPDTKTANTFCGVLATTVASTTTKVACNSHTTQTVDMALSDARAQELYALYAAAAKGKPSTLTQVPLAFQSFGVAVSPLLYAELQAAQGLSGSTAAGQPSITRASYASLVSKGGKVGSLETLLNANKTVAGYTPPTGQTLVLARRDDLSGTQAVSNMFFVNGQCGGNDKAATAKTVDAAVAKAGGLLGGLAIRQDVTDDVAGVLDVQANVTSGNVTTALGSGYAIGVVGTGSGSANFVKIDGVSPNFDGTNFKNATATRAQIAGGAYPFAYTLYGMYVTKTMTDAKNADKKALVDAMMNGFKNSNLTNLSGIAYLDGAETGVAAQQSAFNRANGNNCSPIVKL